MKIDYTPVPSLQPLFTDSKFWNIIIGPIGSTKTSACIFYLLYRAATQRVDSTGYRRTRFVISRTSLPQIKATVLQDIQMYLGPLIEWRPSDNLIRIRAGDVQSDWYLVPLETVQDQRRLLSMQLSGVWFNEGREIPFELITAAAGRVRRFPPHSEGGVTHPFVLIDSNPGAVGSPLYNFCMEHKDRDDVLYIHQPSALSPEADWLHYLQGGIEYYETIMTGASPDWIEVHVHGRWGKDLQGLGVFSAVFDETKHVAPLRYNPDLPLVVGLDPGRRPAAVICQLHPNGQLRVLEEMWADDVSFVTFIRDRLRHRLIERYFRSRALIVMDPAGAARTAMSEHSPYTFCTGLGLEVRLAPTNNLDARRMAVERLLTSFDHSGNPQLLVDPSCTVLVRALRGEYRYRRKRTGDLDNVPEKQHPISDVADALQYAALSLTHSVRLLHTPMSQPVVQPSFTGYSFGAFTG